ncbi:mechanosensitive ion channel [Lujinxingia vulgaris]|uniref:Mechanosensitive ion channel n=1 Tax=Lujinxingia vulgaris TaxID=2600176 RepID=A0A5C6XGX5_9DELT|nr:BON domain-containing protein [Lujinxingia vulgaris]TXD36691.1 mechanosensitive ion channel [Lujinxingia vulgaris]
MAPRHPRPTPLLTPLFTLALVLLCALPLRAQEPDSDAEAEPVEERTVPLKLPDQSAADEALQAQIRRTFQAIDVLQDVVIDVRASVVRLAGELPSSADKELAGDIASRFEGVVYVQNNIDFEHFEDTSSDTEEPEPKALSADEVIAERLQAIFAQIRPLQDVQVEVNNGVVSIRGESATNEASTRAEELASGMPGVLYVDNQLTEAVDVADRLSPTWERLRDFALNLVRRIPLFLLAIFIIGIFWFLSKALVLWEWPFERLTRNVLARGLIKQALRVIIVLGGLLIALDLLDATTIVGAVLGTAGVFGIALGFAFRDIAENYLASVLLSVRRPFEANDLVDIEGFRGRIVRLTMRETILMTEDGNHVRISNATVFKSNITNFSRNPRRRLDFCVGVGNEEDLPRALTLGVSTLKALEGVLEDPRPQGLVELLGDSSVTIWFTAWVDQRAVGFLKVKSEAIRRVKEAFDDVGIDMPSPIYTINIVGADSPASPQPPRKKPPVRSIPTDEVLDVGLDDEIERQVDEEREASGEEDLLDEGKTGK